MLLIPEELRYVASHGHSNEAIAGYFDLTTEEFEAQLKESGELQKALTIGRLQVKSHLEQQLWERSKTNPQFLILMAKLKLGNDYITQNENLLTTK